MPEQVTTGFRRVFEVRLLHHYWLDDGATVFDQIPDQARRDTRLLTYDARPLLAVAPTPATEGILAGHQCLFRETNVGFTVLAPGALNIAPDTVLEFVVSVRDPAFFQYTALTLPPQRVYAIYYLQEKRTYRYKENVPLLSNTSGAKRGTTLFLSQEPPAPAAGDLVESIVLSGSALEQLTSDNPGATTQVIAASAGDPPVYVTQGDVEDITPPAGLTGAPAKGVRLQDGVADDVFVYISLTAASPDTDFSFVDGGGALTAQAPVYEVRFKNRSTFWRYVDKTTGAVNSTEPKPLPLTYFGNAGTKQKPSGGPVRAEKSGPRITQLVSEIYV
jgi:hypothetical protein